MLGKSTLREIKTTIERWLAILAIVALGVGFFSGLKLCKPAMIETAEEYLSKTNLFDYQIMSSYGIDENSIKLAEQTKGVSEAEAAIEKDILLEAKEGTVRGVKVYSLPEKINLPKLTKGRMPKAANECLADNNSGLKIGDEVVLSDTNKSSDLDMFKEKKFKVTGLATSPLFLDFNRGSTDIGNGDISAFMYLPKSSFDLDYYTQLYLKLDIKGDYFKDSTDDKLLEKESLVKNLATKINNARRDEAIAKGQEKLSKSEAEYENAVSEFTVSKNEALAKLEEGEKKLNESENLLNSKSAELNKQLELAKNGKTELAGGIQKLDDGIAQIEGILSSGQPLPPEVIAELNAKLEGLKAKKTELVGKHTELEANIAAIEGGLAKIKESAKEIQTGRNELAAQRANADAEFAKAEAELNDAKAELDKAKSKILNMDEGKSYTFSRSENMGFSTFRQNSSIVSNIAKIFPVFFFLVAALVCMTTMTRMIEEQRTQIGILRALGYSNSKIAAKYTLYSSSAAVIGSIVGYFAGIKVFPKVIWNAYQMMYDFNKDIKYVIDWKLAILSLAVAIVGTVGTTILCCRGDFKEEPAQLIRPKAPPEGKRILLERFPKLWNKLSFLYKVSIRNTFRYKKRFIMMVLGISGCTALLVAANGLSTSIKNTAVYQFGEVQLYDYMTVFDNEITDADKTSFNSYMGDKASDIIYLSQTNADLRTGSNLYEVSLVAADVHGKEADKRFSKFVNLHNGEKKVAYPGEGEAVICKKLSKTFGFDVGDTIKVKDGYNQMSLKVTGVFDNFVGDYIYVTDTTYQNGMGEKAPVKNAFVLSSSSDDTKKVRSEAAYAGRNSMASAAIVNDDLIQRVDNMMKSLNLVVYAVVAAAALLAFIVLYNLTNINILERIREIATIKVLGFNNKEVSQYVFRENIFLTVIAAVVGLPMGYGLLNFAISNIVVNGVFFETRLDFGDYFMGFIMTLVFAFVVGIVMQRKLRAVNMTESLKSIE